MKVLEVAQELMKFRTETGNEKEVNDAIDNARKLLNEFVRDYGKFRLNKKNEDIDDWNAFFKIFF